MTKKRYDKVVVRISGENSKRETPVPIPNTEVKPFNAKSTDLEMNWEDRNLPV